MRRTPSAEERVQRPRSAAAPISSRPVRPAAAPGGPAASTPLPGPLLLSHHRKAHLILLLVRKRIQGGMGLQSTVRGGSAPALASPAPASPAAVWQAGHPLISAARFCTVYLFCLAFLASFSLIASLFWLGCAAGDAQRGYSGRELEARATGTVVACGGCGCPPQLVAVLCECQMMAALHRIPPCSPPERWRAGSARPPLPEMPPSAQRPCTAP